MSTYIYQYISVYIKLNVCINMYADKCCTNKDTFMHKCIDLKIYITIYMCMHIYMYIYMKTCMSVQINQYLYAQVNM
jgi:hypothetical protein